MPSPRPFAPPWLRHRAEPDRTTLLSRRRVWALHLLVRVASPIEHYGFLSNLHGSALVSLSGSVDWLCLPRFDSDACMAALLGREEHGHWSLYPGAEVRATRRRYRPGTLILETDYECEGGAVRLVDFMPLAQGRHSLVRIVQGLSGMVPIDFSLCVRFGYGQYKPWTRPSNGDTIMTTAPDTVVLRTKATLQYDEDYLRGVVIAREGKSTTFELSWSASHLPIAEPLDVRAALAETEQQAAEWTDRCRYRGPYREAVSRSLITLKGLTYRPSGGIVAAPTAGLPEEIGGVRNWDYRFCWLRDATLTLDALMKGGYVEEADAWRHWLWKAIAGSPAQAQIMYGVEGEHRLTEFEAQWLPGYEESRPVRFGNAASDQFQLDVYGEVINVLYEAQRLGLNEVPYVRTPAFRLMTFVESMWQRPDDGIWEVRGGRRHFVYSKMMAWVAADRMARMIEEFHPPDDPARGLLPRWRSLADRIHRDICAHGFDRRQNAFTQAYNSPALDATALLMPALGFLPASDDRVKGTIQAVEKNLLHDGFVLRYRTDDGSDGLPGSEGAFLACSFWLVDAYVHSGRRAEAEALFERLLAVRNDLGLLSEEYDPRAGRLVGNFPQAFSHLALIHSAYLLNQDEPKPRLAANV